ncbi:MAG: KH domain-containing protein [Clostridia bacterium]|nr:KH domain-containing protein [Clostridia bacterium]
MVDLIKYIVNSFADKKEMVEIEETVSGKEVTVTVTLDPEDMGKVIGRQGKIAKAIRTLVHAASLKQNKKYNLEIKEREA